MSESGNVDRAVETPARWDGVAVKLFVVASLGLALTFAVLRVFDPLGGDGGLFLVGAKMVSEGAVLYEDFWDFKQPGIFHFYGTAGALFGYDYLGIQLFQLLYWMASAALIVWLLYGFMLRRSFAFLAPLVFLGTYYAHAPINFFGQSRFSSPPSSSSR